MVLLSWRVIRQHKVISVEVLFLYLNRSTDHLGRMMDSCSMLDLDIKGGSLGRVRKKIG